MISHLLIAEETPAIGTKDNDQIYFYLILNKLDLSRYNIRIFWASKVFKEVF